jgi:hypothetical protein
MGYFPPISSTLKQTAEYDDNDQGTKTVEYVSNWTVKHMTPSLHRYRGGGGSASIEF